MKLENVLKHNKPRNKVNFFSSFSSEVKDSVDGVLDREPCPNCSTDMLNNKCFSCGYWLGEDYFQYLTEKLDIKRIPKNKEEKIELRTITGDCFFVFKEGCTISESSASLLVEIEWEKIRFTTTYSLLKKEESVTIHNIKFDTMPEVIKNWKWKKKYIEFKYLKKFVFSVLIDTKINPFL